MNGTLQRLAAHDWLLPPLHCSCVRTCARAHTHVSEECFENRRRYSFEHFNHLEKEPALRIPSWLFFLFHMYNFEWNAWRSYCLLYVPLCGRWLVCLIFHVAWYLILSFDMVSFFVVSDSIQQRYFLIEITIFNSVFIFILWIVIE